MIEIWADLLDENIKVAFGDEEFSINPTQARFMIEKLNQALLVIESHANVEAYHLGMWEDYPIGI
jgi:hypothetical protein